MYCTEVYDIAVETGDASLRIDPGVGDARMGLFSTVPVFTYPSNSRIRKFNNNE
jgi:hypothetical protein